MSKKMFDLSNEVIIITGANGLLGKQFSNLLLNQGARIVMLDKNISNKLERDFYSLRSDVTSAVSLKQALGKIKKNFSTPTGLINCAAVNELPNSNNRSNKFEHYSIKNYQKTMDVNVKGVFLSCQIFGTEMAKKRKGSIINISSIYGLLSPDHRLYHRGSKKYFKPIDYSISKSAIINLTKYLSVYWANDKVRVNNLILGGIKNSQDKNFVHKYSKRVPLGRMANLDEFDSAVVYLLSKGSSYMTGSDMIIDGGWTAW